MNWTLKSKLYKVQTCKKVRLGCISNAYFKTWQKIIHHCELYSFDCVPKYEKINFALLEIQNIFVLLNSSSIRGVMIDLRIYLSLTRRWCHLQFRIYLMHHFPESISTRQIKLFTIYLNLLHLLNGFSIYSLIEFKPSIHRPSSTFYTSHSNHVFIYVQGTLGSGSTVYPLVLI